MSNETTTTTRQTPYPYTVPVMPPKPEHVGFEPGCYTLSAMQLVDLLVELTAICGSCALVEIIEGRVDSDTANGIVYDAIQEFADAEMGPDHGPNDTNH